MEGLVIGDGTVVEVNALVEGSVGAGSVVEVGVKIGKGGRVGSVCFHSAAVGGEE